MAAITGDGHITCPTIRRPTTSAHGPAEELAGATHDSGAIEPAFEKLACERGWGFK
jgi:hypothetical protein